jgi:hypothetical protein
MRVLILLVVISLVYVSPAAAYEVIFHQGFEGEQFPPEGWDLRGFQHVSPGHDSDWCVYGTVFSMEYSIHAESPDVYLESGDIYTLRFYEECWTYGSVTIRERFYFDDGTYVEFGPKSLRSPWSKTELNIEIPLTTNYGYFLICGWPDDHDSGILLYLDDFSVIHTATSITPASLGRVKAAYR